MYDPTDNRGVPVSKGVPPAVRYAAAIGLVFIFGMGFLTVFDAGYGHKWPAATTLRLNLK
ncbi:MAG: hypothetical protein M3126_08410 [Candidatus Eremiobacteraeota bacterium]|nr:hypothetical protein [Candidatus Eremiobacteraeota bacterium]